MSCGPAVAQDAKGKTGVDFFFLKALKQSQEEQEKVCLIDRAAWLLSILTKGSNAAAKALLMCQRDPALHSAACASRAEQTRALR